MSVNRVIWTVVFTAALGLAQNPAPAGQGTSQMPDPSTQPQTSSQSPDMSGNRDSNASQAKGEKKLKGCIEAQGNQFVLRDKHGKDVVLSGSQDFASHVGHTVSIQGKYASDSGSAGTSTAGSTDQFMVSKLDMVSNKCKTDAEKTPDSKPSPYHQ